MNLRQQRLGGKVILVTGGTYGLGRACTLLLAAEGAKVVAFGLDTKQLGSTAELGSTATSAALATEGLSADVLEGDVANPADLDRVVEHTTNTHGRIDGLVNNAAIHPSGTAVDTTTETWDAVLSVNLRGPYLLCQRVIPVMLNQGGGAIVNVASNAAWGQPNLCAYSASKGGLIGLTGSIHADFGQQNIRCNLVVPSRMLTGMTEGSSRSAGLTDPIDIAPTIAFLLSDEASQVFGTTLHVNHPAL